LDTFRRTLKAFVGVVKQINADSQLNIPIKDPTELTLGDCLGILNQITEHSESSSKTRSCKKFIRGCYRKVEDNREIIGEILAIVPMDIYGSVISGGFTLILAVSCLLIRSTRIQENAHMVAYLSTFNRRSKGMLKSAKRLRTS
jgi:hypothetical protein